MRDFKFPAGPLVIGPRADSDAHGRDPAQRTEPFIGMNEVPRVHMARRSESTSMVTYRGVPTRTWREVPLPASFEVRALLSGVAGGVGLDRRAARELWRVRYGASVFTAYQNGTIYCTGGLEENLTRVYLRIDEKLLGRKRLTPRVR